MRNFGVIHARYWTWALEHELSDDAKIIGAYYLSCEHSNSAGCYRIPMEYVAADLGYPIDRVSKGYFELESLGFIAYCERSKWALIPKYLKWNPLQNAKHAIGTKRLLSQIPSSFTLFDKLERSLRKFGGRYFTEEMVDSLIDTLCDRVSDSVSKEYRYTDQDQDQDKDQDNTPPNPPKGGGSDPPDPPPDPPKPFKVPTGEELSVSNPWVNQTAWDEFVNHRVSIRQKLSEDAVKKNLGILKQYDANTQQEIVDETIRNNWRGLFHPKNNGRRPKGQDLQQRIVAKYERKYGRDGQGETNRQNAAHDGTLF